MFFFYVSLYLCHALLLFILHMCSICCTILILILFFSLGGSYELQQMTAVENSLHFAVHKLSLYEVGVN